MLETHDLNSVSLRRKLLVRIHPQMDVGVAGMALDGVSSSMATLSSRVSASGSNDKHGP